MLRRKASLSISQIVGEPKMPPISTGFNQDYLSNAELYAEKNTGPKRQVGNTFGTKCFKINPRSKVFYYQQFGESTPIAEQLIAPTATKTFHKQKATGNRLLPLMQASENLMTLQKMALKTEKTPVGTHFTATPNLSPERVPLDTQDGSVNYKSELTETDFDYSKEMRH